MDLFLEVLLKFQKIFKNKDEQMLLIYIFHTAIRKGSSHHKSSLIKKLINFSKDKGNAYVVLGFVCPTNELRDCSDKPVKQKSVQKQPQEVFFKIC